MSQAVAMTQDPSLITLQRTRDEGGTGTIAARVMCEKREGGGGG
jgi:hypothetical protein